MKFSKDWMILILVFFSKSSIAMETNTYAKNPRLKLVTEQAAVQAQLPVSKLSPETKNLPNAQEDYFHEVNTCAKKPRLKLAAEQAATQIASRIKNLPSGLEGFDSVGVADIGSNKICSSLQWADEALGLPTPQMAMMPSCGIVYYFKNKDTLKSFAKNFIALKSPSYIKINLVKEGHDGYMVSQDDMEYFSVPLCAAVK